MKLSAHLGEARSFCGAPACTATSLASSVASVTLRRGSSFGFLFAGFDDGFHATVERAQRPSKRHHSELLNRLVAGDRLSDKLLVTARVLALPCALFQSFDERVGS
jgi:hypothetical protein